MNEACSLFRLLGDEARFRILRVLARERLNVTELTGVLGMAQSGVSRHLGLLKEAGLLIEERDGGFAYHGIAPNVQAGATAPVWRVLEAEFVRAADDPVTRADEARLQEVLRLRKENFDAHGGQAREGRQLVPGRSWAAWARALGHLLPPLVVADLGCGEGYLTIETARWARRVIAVDRSEPVLARARALARRRRVTNIAWRRGDLEQLPLPDGSVDVALLSQALHHATRPERAIREAVRVITEGGRVLILDLRAHDQDWVRRQLDDRWLGFADEDLARLLRQVGLDEVRVGVGARKAGDPFTVLVASGRKPVSATGRRTRSRRTESAVAGPGLGRPGSRL